MSEVVVENVEVAEKPKREKSPMTYKEFLQAVITGTAQVNGMSVIDKATELLAKEQAKSKSADGKPSKAKTESKAEQEAILSYLQTQTETVPCKTIAEAVGLKSPKVNACLKFLVEDGLVKKMDFGRNKPFEYILA